MKKANKVKPKRNYYAVTSGINSGGVMGEQFKTGGHVAGCENKPTEKGEYIIPAISTNEADLNQAQINAMSKVGKAASIAGKRIADIFKKMETKVDGKVVHINFKNHGKR